MGDLIPSLYQIFRRPVVFSDNRCIIQIVTPAGLFARPKDMNFKPVHDNVRVLSFSECLNVSFCPCKWRR
nr:MAG TPA: hypothetical protein [Caudoviricetes sp.]